MDRDQSGPGAYSTSVPSFGGTRGSETHVKVEFRDLPGLTGLVIVNFLLTMITFGIYSFWAKTEVRKHIWSSIHINDEPVEYTGTGIELFLGAMIVGLLIIVPLVILQGVAPILLVESGAASVALQLVVSALFLFLIGVGTYRARRYRLSRSRWRGIRGTLAGSSLAYAASFFWRNLLLFPTLGWAYPWVRTSLARLITNDQRFGNHPFQFQGPSAPLYIPFATVWLGSVVLLAAVGLVVWGTVDVDGFMGGDDAQLPDDVQNQALIILGLVLIVLPIIGVTSGLLWVFYKSAELRYFAQYTSFGNLRFKLNVTSWSLLTLTIGNILIMILTLGIGRPFIQRRLIRYVVNRLETSGTIDIEAIQQSQQQMDKTGEGLAEAFDIDGF